MTLRTSEQLPAAIGLALLLLTAACPAPLVKRSAAESAPPAAASSGQPADYAALSLGNAWTYEVRAGGRTERDTVHIVGRDGPWFLDDHRGRRRLDELGLRDADRYLLRGPLATGKGWSSVEQMVVQRFEITAADAQVTTPAGVYQHCVVVKNQQPLDRGAGTFITEWSYAPKVGLIAMRTRTVDAAGKEQEQLSMQLVAFERDPQ